VKRVWLIARQEYIKYVTRRGFLISVMLFPVWIGLVAFLPRALDRATPSRVFAVIDRAGGYETAIADEIARDDTASTLSALSEYAHTNADMVELRAGAPGIAGVLDNPGDEREVEAFRNSGGVTAMLAGMSRFLKPHAPPFVPPVPKFKLVPAPRELMETTPDTFADVARLYLTGARAVPVDGTSAVLLAVVVLPKDFGVNDSVAAQYWGTNLTDGELRGFLKQTLGDSLRWRAVHRLVPDEAAARSALDSSANIEQINPARGGGGHVGFGDVVASYVPMALAFLLFLVTFMNSSVLLQSVIEEKSTRMIEVLLSCATPREIMSGKLVGVIAVALTTILLWALGLFGVMSLFSQDAIGLALGGLKALATVLQRWVAHLLGVRVAITPLQRIDNAAWRWHVGLDVESMALLNDLYEDRPVDAERTGRLISLFRLEFENPAEMRTDVAGKPVYLGLAMSADGTLRLKPQNLLLNLPLAAPM